MLFCLISCDKLGYNHCKNMPKQIAGGTGEIINNVLLKSNYHSSKEGLVITSDSLNFLNVTVSFDNGATYNPIDFSQYTLLGKYAVGNSRAVFFDRNVTKDVKNQKYIYTIRVISCGEWEDDTNMNWVLVPKIEDNFTVEFIVEHKQWTRK